MRNQKLNRRKLLEGAAAAAGALALGASSRTGWADQSQPSATVNVDTTVRHQLIEGFGASDCWSMDPIGREWSEENKERLAELLFSQRTGAGLSQWRFNVGAGGALADKATLWDSWRGADCFRRSEAEQYDWSRQPGQQWFLRAAKRLGVDQFIAFANSPPVWMTVNGHAHCDKQTGSTNLKPGYELRFAAFLADVVQHFQRQGIPFRYISPLNEPNWNWEGGGQEGCRYNNDDIARVVRALHQEATRRRLKVDIITPEAGDLASMLDDDLWRAWAHNNDPSAHYNLDANQLGKGQYRQYVKLLLGNPELRAMVDARVAAHAYWTDRGELMLAELRRALRQNIARYTPDGRYWQTEYCIMEHGRDLGMDSALRVARVLHHDLVDGNASAWQWWLAVSPADYKDGLIYTDYKKDGEQTVYPSRILWVLGAYSRFVRPGAHRVEVTTQGAEGLLASAYVSADGRGLTIILTNEGREAKRVHVAVNGRPVSLTPHVTSEEHQLAQQPATTRGGEWVAPPRSVAALVGKQLPV